MSRKIPESLRAALEELKKADAGTRAVLADLQQTADALAEHTRSLTARLRKIRGN